MYIKRMYCLLNKNYYKTSKKGIRGIEYHLGYPRQLHLHAVQPVK